MIKNISIKSVASYGNSPECLNELSTFNFIYGSNGVGKTTISRIIADSTNFQNCSLRWQGDPMETLVYNRDFVDKSFNEVSELKGIFTLGKEDKELLDKIDKAKNELDEIRVKGEKLKTTLDGDDETVGKMSELLTLERGFEERCWKLKTKYDSIFKEAFSGVRGKKPQFKAKVISESAINKAELKDLDFLKAKAQTIFGDEPQRVDRISVYDFKKILDLGAIALNDFK